MSCADLRNGQPGPRSAKQRRRRAFLGGSRIGAMLAALLCAVRGAGAADLADILVYPQAGQTPEQARRDRYECHNWAVGQTGVVPAQGPDPQEAEREERAERVGKVVAGAAVGAAAGSIIRGSRDYRDAGDGALGGAVLGAIAGAVIGERQKNDDDDEEDAGFDEYLRALDACMSGRGYSLGVAGEQN